jgi:probable rRNA maturation factor
MQKTTLELNNQYSDLTNPEEGTRRLFDVMLASGKFPIRPGELSVAFVDDATIARVHADFMDDPTPTDVITFPADPEMESAGEIIVSVDHAKSRSEELGEPFSRELALYIIHGWLHLAGYDDLNDEDRQKMRVAEKEALALLTSPSHTVTFKLKSEDE